MAGTEVSSIINDILDAFQNGLSVFRNTARKHKRRHSEPSRSDEDKLTLDSLSQRPLEIKRTFDSMVVIHGTRSEVGDSTAQTSLAQILLVFKSRLIKLLGQILSDDRKARSRARNGIFNLSETAAMDTLVALSELDLRLTSISNLSAKLSAQAKESENADSGKSRPRSSSCGQYMAIRRATPSPSLQNGGWVRSKNNPSTVSVVAATKTKKMDQGKSSASRSSDNSPTSSTLNASTKAKEQKSPPPGYSQLAPKSPPQPRPKPVHLHSYPVTDTLTTVPESIEKHLVRHPSMYIVPGDFFDTFPELAVPRYEPQSVTKPLPSPPIPAKIPLHSFPRQTSATTRQNVVVDKFESAEQPSVVNAPSTLRRESLSSHREKRVRPPSMMTFMTASTKLGEIPDHHLPDRVLTQQEQDRIPMPYVVPEMLELPKKKNRGLKFWKKLERGNFGPITA